MKFQIKVRLFMDNGKVKHVTWTQEDPVVVEKDRDSDEVVNRRPATLDEIRNGITSKIVTYMKEGTIGTLQDSSGEISIVRFGEVKGVSVQVEEVSE